MTMTSFVKVGSSLDFLFLFSSSLPPDELLSIDSYDIEEVSIKRPSIELTLDMVEG